MRVIPAVDRLRRMALIGARRERTRAGYQPAPRLTSTSNAASAPRVPGWVSPRDSSCEKVALKAGRISSARAHPAPNPRTESTAASPTNWRMRWPRPAPTALRTPTSAARSDARPMARLTKLMQPMSSTARAMLPRM